MRVLSAHITHIEDHYTGFLIFYCFLHAPMQLGIEAHSIQIIGNITINSFDFFKSVAVFSYPGELSQK